MIDSVMVAVPSHDMVHARFATDLANLYASASARLMGRVELNVVIGTYVHTAREQLAADAIACGVSHVLWIDSDMRFPADALVRLLAHQLPAVGINYSTRASPGDFTATRIDAPERLITSPDSTGLEEVSALGFGLLLMNTKVLTVTRERGGAPLFRYDWLADRAVWVGEDYSFCHRARAWGGRFWVDHDLSNECAHLGAFEYRPRNAVPQDVPQMEYAT